MIKKELFFPSKKKLPIDGWFQGCVLCDTITANLILFKKETSCEYYAYLCSPCQILIKDPKNFIAYEKECNYLIRKSF